MHDIGGFAHSIPKACTAGIPVHCVKAMHEISSDESACTGLQLQEVPP